MFKRQRNTSQQSASGKSPKRILFEEEIEYMDENSFITGMANNSVLNSTEARQLEHQERVKSLDVAMETLRSCDEPSLKDISNAMLSFMQTQKDSMNEHHAFKNQLFSVTKKVAENSLAIKNMQQDFSDETLSLRAENAQNKQLLIEHELLITGFSAKPDPNLAADKISQILKVTTSSYFNCHAYEFSNRSTKAKEAHVVIKFNSIPDKINFNKAKIKHGPIYLDQLLENAGESSARVPIKFVNRLTPMNREIISKLRDLQTKGKIVKDGIRYRDCFFEAKLINATDFVPVPSLVHLDIIFK
jgi:hypothetical protein